MSAKKEAQGDSLGNRMKEYEDAYRVYLPKRMPVIIRIDGRHFHSFTKKLVKPFDEKLTQAFWQTCKVLAKEVQGCKLAYHQSDEISLLLINYEKLTTESWFGNNLQKIVTGAAAIATQAFNKAIQELYPDIPLKANAEGETEPARFDARAFVLPQDEVANYFHWRQQDATKNSISMVAQEKFPHKSLHGLSGKQKQEKLWQEKGVNWNDLPVWQKRGVCIVKESYEKESVVKGETITALRTRWVVDHETPIFTKDRDYINQFVYIKTETKRKQFKTINLEILKSLRPAELAEYAVYEMGPPYACGLAGTMPFQYFSLLSAEEMLRMTEQGLSGMREEDLEKVREEMNKTALGK